MNQILKPRIRPLFQEAYKEVKYVLEEEEYNEADIEERFVKRFRRGFENLISIYRRTLTDNNFSALMGLLLEALTAQWERIVFQTRFNQYGALRFDKDLRSVIHYLSTLTEWLSRDRFTRLNQMSILLNFEEVIIIVCGSDITAMHTHYFIMPTSLLRFMISGDKRLALLVGD